VGEGKVRVKSKRIEKDILSPRIVGNGFTTEADRGIVMVIVRGEDHILDGRGFICVHSERRRPIESGGRERVRRKARLKLTSDLT
jgi:hypothetical protein